jgi:magnesium-transporting ATPase (P-type)
MYCEMKWISGVEVYQSSSPDEEALVKAARAYGVRLKEVLLLRIRIFIDFWIQIQF